MSQSNGRSLYNTSQQAIASQGTAILQNTLAVFRSLSDLKIIKNAQLSDSLIENTAIGTVIPASGRFTTLVVGLQNLSNTVTFYGSNNSTLNWSTNALSLSNATLAVNNTPITSNDTLSLKGSNGISLSTDNNAPLTVSGGNVMFQNDTIGLTWPNQVGIQSRTATNSLLLSDPIPELASPTTTTTTDTDSGWLMNKSFVGIAAASHLSTYMTKSFQLIKTPQIALVNANTKKVTTIANDALGAEFDYLYAKKQLLSVEKINLADLLLSPNNTGQIILNTDVAITKVFCAGDIRTTSTFTIKLPNGDNDGQFKIIQWLPYPNSIMSIPENVSTCLTIYGSFCQQRYSTTQPSKTEFLYDYAAIMNGAQNSITLTVPGSSIYLIYDTTIAAWCMLSNSIC